MPKLYGLTASKYPTWKWTIHHIFWCEDLAVKLIFNNDWMYTTPGSALLWSIWTWVLRDFLQTKQVIAADSTSQASTYSNSIWVHFPLLILISSWSSACHSVCVQSSQNISKSYIYIYITSRTLRFMASICSIMRKKRRTTRNYIPRIMASSDWVVPVFGSFTVWLIGVNCLGFSMEPVLVD